MAMQLTQKSKPRRHARAAPWRSLRSVVRREVSCVPALLRSSRSSPPSDRTGMPSETQANDDHAAAMTRETFREVASDQWHEGLTRRLRSLLRTDPFHRLRASQSRIESVLPHDDLLAVAMKGLELLIDCLGVSAGLSRDDFAAGVRPLLVGGDQLAAVAPDTERHSRICAIVIAALLNDAGRRQAFVDEYMVLVDGKPERRTLRYRLCSEQESLDGDTVLRVEPDGVNLFLRSLDVELEDAQAAVEAAMKAQLARGRLDLALQSAKEARVRSIQYRDKIEQALRRTRRDVGRVDWRREVPKLIADALGHLDARLRVERELAEAASDARLALLGSEQAVLLTKICDLVDDCLARHLALHRSLFTVHEVFRHEQERQRFAPVPLRPHPAPEKELLVGILGGSLAEAGAVAEAFFVATLPARVPPFLDLGRLWDRLLRPARSDTPIGRPLDQALESLSRPPPTFAPELITRVDARLAQLRSPTSLSDELADTPDTVEAHYLVLRTLSLFGAEPDATRDWQPRRLNRALSDKRYLGDDVGLGPEVEHDE